MEATRPAAGQPWVGRGAQRSVRITAAELDRFVELSGDHSAIHVDDQAAKNRGFRGRVVHGAMLASLVSAVIGTQLPGDCGVLQDMQLAFRNPCYPGDEIEVRVQVSEFFESVSVLVLAVRVTRSDGILLASGQVRCGITASGGSAA